MESLYRKYRPLTFESVVGQQHIVSTLEHAVAEGRLSHAYLFCGPRGTGKTTMARILAKSLLCQGADAARAAGASGCMPDGTCPECEAIAAGAHPDVYELDAASRTGVDNVREEIIGSVNFAPVRGAYKVYIIDEVHMLTAAAFNALLKTLEEPPSHVVFVLCTTDPQKILETILSRCQRFDFHRISNDDIVGRLRFICEQEGFAFDEAALEIVAKHARGGMRDALSTLEQLSVFGDGSVRVEDARDLLGEVASTVLSEFACKIAVRDTVGLFGLVRSQADAGNDLLELTRDLVAHMRDVYTAAIAGPRMELFDGTPDEVATLVEEAALFESADRLARTLTVLDDAALEMRDASDPRLVLEIAFTRLARPETDLTLESLAERILHLETQLSAGIPRGPMTPDQRANVTGGAKRAAAAAPAHVAASTPESASASVPSVPAAVSAPVAPAAVERPTSAPTKAVQNREKPSDSVKTRASEPVSVSHVAPEPLASTAPTSAVSSGDAGELQRRWIEVVKLVTAAQASRGALLQSSRAVGDDGETLTVAFPKGSTFALKMITRPDSHQLVTPIIYQVFGERTVVYEMEGAAAPTVPASAPVVSAPATSGPASPAASVPIAPAPEKASQDRDFLQNSEENRPRATASPAAVPTPAPVAVPVVPPASVPAVPFAAPTPAPVAVPAVEPNPQAWEDDLPPYDDVYIDSYDDPEAPPFEVAESAVAPEPMDNPAPAAPESKPPAAAELQAPVEPQAAADSARVESHTNAETSDDAKSILENAFGTIIFK